MRRGTLVIGLCLAIFLVTVAAMRDAAATYGRAEIWIPEKEKPLEMYKRACEREVVPRFVAYLKKQNPDMDEKKVAKEIVAGVDGEKRTIVVYVPAEDANTAIEYGEKIGEMAAGHFAKRAESGRMDILHQLKRERERVMEEIRALQDELAAVRREQGMYDPRREMECLVTRLNAFKEELVRAELMGAELEAKVKLLSKKAEEAMQTVSAEEIASLQKTAQELAVGIETSKEFRGKKLERCMIILRQKEAEYERIKQLHSRNLLSEKELGDARAELDLVRNDYEMATLEAAQLKAQLDRVRKELAKAKERFGGAGGLELARHIAGKTLECETEMAGIKARMRRLRSGIQEVQAEIGARGSTAAALERRQGEIERLRKRLQGLLDREAAVQGQMVGASRPEIVMVEAVERIPEHAPTYAVVGEVKKPGLYELVKKRTVLTAIAAAGGFTEYTNEKGVVVISNPERSGKSHRFDLNAILKGESPDEFVIQPGDVLWVPRKTVLQ